MPQNLYYVQPGDTLSEIARRYGVTLQDMMAANVICNPNWIFVDQVLVIPTPGLNLPKAGGGPYYVVLPGDTLYCLAQQLNTTVQLLASINKIANPNIIFAGSELLLAPAIPDPAELKASWEAAAQQCATLNSLQIHGVYYIGSFQWAALGRKAIPYLLQFLKNQCDVVRYYAVLSLGRIAKNRQVKAALNAMLNDTPEIINLARLALRRIDLAARGRERIHLTTTSTFLAEEPLLASDAIELPAGTEVIVRRWNIPSPTGEEMPPGGLAIWDEVQVYATGQVGYLLRVGYQEIELM